MKIVAVIPSHLASVRFPRKILFEIYGIPMIEHVRRRAKLCKKLQDVYVATCDSEIELAIKGYGGNVILTSNVHKNGTSRVAEAIKSIDCTHILLLQGDEPLLLPEYLDLFVKAIEEKPHVDAWNATGPIETEEESNRHSFVKCIVNQNDRILFCFRRSPFYGDINKTSKIMRKILGIIAFRKEFLLELANLTSSPFEEIEFIEQMRIIENEFLLYSIPVSESLPSINEPDEAKIVLDVLEKNPQQNLLLQKILS
jgi:3-deoxy-manno-octulosonate cytidylyltransferase (CMP-KDO synthetase)